MTSHHHPFNLPPTPPTASPHTHKRMEVTIAISTWSDIMKTPHHPSPPLAFPRLPSPSLAFPRLPSPSLASPRHPSHPLSPLQPPIGSPTRATHLVCVFMIARWRAGRLRDSSVVSEGFSLNLLRLSSQISNRMLQNSIDGAQMVFTSSFTILIHDTKISFGDSCRFSPPLNARWRARML